jgi:hypothetical protein
MMEFKSKHERGIDTKNCNVKGCSIRVRPEDGMVNEPGFPWPESMRQVCSIHTPKEED